MTPLGAIQAATVNAAALLDKSNEEGEIEPGKYADVIAVEGDPVQDITVMERVVFVMKGGALIKNRNAKTTYP
jgi:imidazolonepropionase-like amidohydrolase